MAKHIPTEKAAKPESNNSKPLPNKSDEKQYIGFYALVLTLIAYGLLIFGLINTFYLSIFLISFPSAGESMFTETMVIVIICFVGFYWLKKIAKRL